MDGFCTSLFWPMLLEVRFKINLSILKKSITKMDSNVSPTNIFLHTKNFGIIRKKILL